MNSYLSSMSCARTVHTIHRPPSSRAFTLVLALAIMFMLLTLVMSLVAFLSFELRLTEARADWRRAQLVAYSGLRMALAHLQQEAGADRRVTVQANATGPGDVIEKEDQWRKYWEGRNPYWTAVWDARTGKGARPPAWLVSGERQLHTLAEKTRYEEGYNTPWEVHEDNEERVTLVSRQKKKTDEQLFDSTVTVKSIPLLDPDNQTMGRVAYWVGDEGVKARLNLRDKFPEELPSSARGLARLLASRNAIELFPGWMAVEREDGDKKIASALDAAGFLNLKGLPKGDGIHPYRHAVTAHSQGLLTSARWGGLKHDMSLIFEDNLSLSDFNEQFGKSQSRLPITLNIKPKFAKVSDQEVLPDSTISWENWEKIRMVIADDGAGPSGRAANPLYSIELGMVDSSYEGIVESWVRGPTWELLRNYYRLYKDEMDPEGGRRNFSQGSLRARTFYPSASTIKNEGVDEGGGGPSPFPFTYSWLCNSLALQNGSANAYQTDKVRYKNFGKHAILRPTKAAITPHLSRFVLMLSVRAVGEEGKKKIRLVLNPVVVLHNPFNVPIHLAGKGNYPVRYSLRNAVFDITMTKNNEEHRVDLTRLFGRVNSLETLHILIPSTLMQPGEYRIFSSPSFEPIPSPNNIFPLGNNFNPEGGVYFENIWNDGPLEIEAGESIRMAVRLKKFEKGSGDNTEQMKQSTLQVYEMIDSWDQDDIEVVSGDILTPTTKCSIHGEIVVANARVFAGDMGWTQMVMEKTIDYAQLGGTNFPMAFADFFQKTLLWPNDYKNFGNLVYPKPSELYSGNNFPRIAMSNPLAPVYAKYAQATMEGYAVTSPSWQFCFGGEGIPDWGGFIEMPDSYRTFGGYSHASSPVGVVASVAVPRTPMLSIGQFQHAPFIPYDHVPLLGVGHALPSPYLPVNLISLGACWPYNTNDYSWLMNTALWDRFYFSTIAPKVNSASISKAPVEVSKQAAVWSDFISGKAPLTNQYFLLNPYTDEGTRKDLLKDKYAWYKSAAYLLQEGTFNVNAMDTRAWKTVLGGTKGTKAAGGKNGTTEIGSDDRTPLPRMNPSPPSTAASKSISTEEAWSGAKLLENKQIEQLSKSIVEAVRKRFSSEHNRGGHVDEAHKTKVTYSTKTGVGDTVEICRPFFSLAEFINRCVNPYADKDAKDDITRLGAMQRALFHADKNGANINTSLVGGQVLRSDMLNKGGEDNAFKFPNSVAFTDTANQIPMAANATGMTLQGDVFQAIGSRLNVRSDTFIVRTYGITEGKINSRVTGRAWLEAVVQRYPDFMWTGNDPTHGKQDADIMPENDPDKRKLNPVNRYFGRRFRIVSMRWLSPDEV